MRIKFSPPDISDAEINEVVGTLKSGWITTGPKTKEFEKRIADYCGVNKAACLNSATAGLKLILKVLGIGPGDEVITSAYTYTASASIINHVGAKIVLCDTKKDSYEMDYDKLSSLITNKTKAIIPVDIAGVICDYEKVFDIVESKKEIFTPRNEIQEKFGRIVVIADAAHSFGATRNGQKSGSIADFSSFSFHAVKNLTTAEGGAVVWKPRSFLNDDDLYKKFMLWSLHGQSKDALAKDSMGDWEYDIMVCGLKCNMTDIMAAIGLAQLNRYEKLLARRHEIIERYQQALKGCNVQFIQHKTNNACSSAHLMLTRINGFEESPRNQLIAKLAELEVPTNVHYKPLPMFTAYKNLGLDIKDYPNAYDQYKNEITLPLHTLLSDEDVDYIIECIKKTL